MKKLKIIYAIIVVIGFTACNIAGLDYQESYKYDASVKEGQVNMTAYDFIESRPDIFSSMLEGINYAGLQEEYKKDNRTFILLTNKALSDETYKPGTGSVFGSYFANNLIVNPNYNPADIAQFGPQLFIPDSWDVYPVAQVKEFFQYHIILDNVVSFTTGKRTPYLYKTAALSEINDSAYISIHVFYDRLSAIHINNMVGLPKLYNQVPRTSNIGCTNGIMHVLDNYLREPTREVVNSYLIKQ